MKAKFGFCLPVCGGSSIYDYDLNDFSKMRSAIEEAEKLGYNSVWAPDHLMLGSGQRVLECWTVLASASQFTHTMRLGSLVTCTTHRAPSLLAKMIATLDVISNGRAELGLGAGWHRVEQLSYGLPWEPKPKERVQRLVEAIEIIKGMWTNDHFSYHGSYYSVKDAACLPRPLQTPHPKIWVGGSGERLLLKAVAENADGWNVDEISPEDYARKLSILRNHCNAASTDFTRIEKSLETMVLITESKAERESFVAWANSAERDSAEAKGIKPNVITADEVRKRFILGSVRDVTEKISQYVEVGVTQFMMYFLDYPSTANMRLFAREIAPSFG